MADNAPQSSLQSTGESTTLGTPIDQQQHMMENILKQQKKMMDEILNKQNEMADAILNRQSEMMERQIKSIEKLSNNTQQPPRIYYAKETNGWTPVLSNIARSSSIKPELESWKDTLDTLLIFIALFSAIVTSFLVPALAGLSQDPAERTNELVSNLTEVIIQLSQGQTSSLDFPESIPFNPNPGVIRQVVFWTLSLLTSVSIASLAVIQRTYPASIARVSRETTEAHNKLIMMLVRWTESTRLLKPAVDALPYILIIAVVLFIAGLLNTVFASAFALSPIPKPVFAAGVISSVIVGFCGAAIIQTIFFGLAPVQMRFLYPVYIWDTISKWYDTARAAASWQNFQRMLRYIPKIYRRHQLSTPTETMVLEAYHTMLVNTYDHHDTAKIAGSLWGIIQPTVLQSKHTEKVTQIIVDLLLPEYGEKANSTCAFTIIKYYRYLDPNDQHFSLLQRQRARIIKALCTALETDYNEYPRREASERLWTSPYMEALATIHLLESSEDNCHDAPCMLLLFAELGSGLETELRQVQALAASSLFYTQCVVAGVPQNPSGDPLSGNPLSVLFGSMGDLRSHPIFKNRQNMIALIDSWNAYRDMTDSAQLTDIDTALRELCRCLSRRGLQVFAEAALEQAQKFRTNEPLVTQLLDAVALFRLRETDPDPRSYSDIVSRVISLAEDVLGAPTAMSSELREGIIAVVQNMAHRLEDKAAWARETTTQDQEAWVKEPMAKVTSADGEVTRNTVVEGVKSAKWARVILADVTRAKAILKDLPKAEAILADAKRRLEQLTVPDSNSQRGHLQEDVHAVNEQARRAILAAFPATPVPPAPAQTTPEQAVAVPATSGSSTSAPAAPAPAAHTPAGAAPAGPAPAEPTPAALASAAPDEHA